MVVNSTGLIFQVKDWMTSMLAEDNLSISDLRTKLKVSDRSSIAGYTLSTSQNTLNSCLGPCAILMCNSIFEEAQSLQFSKKLAELCIQSVEMEHNSVSRNCLYLELLPTARCCNDYILGSSESDSKIVAIDLIIMNIDRTLYMEHLQWSTEAHNSQRIVQQQQLTFCISLVT